MDLWRSSRSRLERTTKFAREKMMRNRLGTSFVVFTAAVLFCLGLIHPAPARADIYGFQDKNGHWHFPAVQPSPKVDHSEDAAAVLVQKYGLVIEQASSRYGLETSLIKAVIRAESDFDPRAVSRKGAIGLMQLMPETAEKMNVRNPLNPEENILGGSRYLGDLLKRFGNDKRLAVAAYNAGPTRVEETGGVPPIEETQQFVKRVMGYYEDYKEER